ncbi:MAG: hypothetical protein Q7S32_00050 [bacterium]|nr:hypothetical protein [bacterium]
MYHHGQRIEGWDPKQGYDANNGSGFTLAENRRLTPGECFRQNQLRRALEGELGLKPELDRKNTAGGRTGSWFGRPEAREEAEVHDPLRRYVPREEIAGGRTPEEVLDALAEAEREFAADRDPEYIPDVPARDRVYAAK